MYVRERIEKERERKRERERGRERKRWPELVVFHHYDVISR